MSNCIFCDIVQGTIPAAAIHSTANTLSFLDIAPVRPGHALVIPKAHHPTLWDVPPELGNELLEALQNVAQAIRKATQADGLNVMMNNYRAAGQLVDHAHFHLIPRHEGDGLHLWPQGAYPSPEAMQSTAAAIRAALA
ncbi:MAG: HIT family protein [Desulfovibrionales bacterium]|nr:MAG: HIT family protein [Desulfovibrionales bacterium]